MTPIYKDIEILDEAGSLGSLEKLKFSGSGQNTTVGVDGTVTVAISGISGGLPLKYITSPTTIPNVNQMALFNSIFLDAALTIEGELVVYV
jgi:hypothetical protein